MFQRKNLRRKLKDLTYEFVDARIQLTSNHSPVSHACSYLGRRCDCLHEAIQSLRPGNRHFQCKNGLQPAVGLQRSSIFRPSGYQKFEFDLRPALRYFQMRLRNTWRVSPVPYLYRETPIIGMAVNWAINEENEKEILRVSIVNEYGQLLFDSIIQPSLTICYAPLYYGYLYDPSFGIPIKYLSDMVRTLLDSIA